MTRRLDSPADRIALEPGRVVQLRPVATPTGIPLYIPSDDTQPARVGRGEL